MQNDEKEKENIVEIFKKEDKFYAFGFARSDGSINEDLDSKTKGIKFILFFENFYYIFFFFLIILH